MKWVRETKHGLTIHGLTLREFHDLLDDEGALVAWLRVDKHVTPHVYSASLMDAAWTNIQMPDVTSLAEAKAHVINQLVLRRLDDE